ncbi:MAG: alpha/beta hydrolase [Clostridia bacterium]|nr:alpha/beta hydrolase [Clostridia bacterium]
MNQGTFALHERFPGTTLTPYVHHVSTTCPHAPRPAMLVLPGGGYEFCYDGEAEPIALSYMNAGFNAYVLRYACKQDAKFPRPLLEASYAMKLIRDRAAEDNTDPNRVYVIGFSAGGHLAGALATCWQREEIYTAAGIAYGENKPNGVILSYPVVSSGEYRHAGTFCRACGKQDPTQEERAAYAAVDNVTEHCPPVFLWHTASDGAVPVENSLLMATALAAKRIPFALHIFPHGNHGLCLATSETSKGEASAELSDVAEWMHLSITWLANLPK